MAASAVRVFRTFPFDGIDLDWEYPCYGEAEIASSPEDKANFTLLLKTIREALDGQGAQDGRHYLLTIAAGADQYYVDGTEMDQVQQYLDYVQLMTYDMRGGFQMLTGHHSNLYTPTGDLFRISADASVKLFLAAGVPKEKLVIGAAFYSRIWNGCPTAIAAFTRWRAAPAATVRISPIRSGIYRQERLCPLLGRRSLRAVSVQRQQLHLLRGRGIDCTNASYVKATASPGSCSGNTAGPNATIAERDAPRSSVERLII